jgi:hypothetical protein
VTIDITSDLIVEQNGQLVGPYRRPRNLAHSQKGSIHDDATATKLGFRGGTVAGSIHMEQFPPILLRAFGQRWFETGTLSCDFRNATVGEEAVRTLAQAPVVGVEDAQINVWMERDDGLQVLEGTASLGKPAAPSLLRPKLAEVREQGEIRILTDLRAGQELAAVPTRVDLADAGVASRIEALTEPLAWYTGPSPWGGPVLNPGLVVHAMVAIQQRMPVRKAVGLYGAIEIAHVRGPVFANHDYEVTGEILAVGTTPKTEYVWFESRMRDAGGTEDVASMLMQLRFMKDSSPLWAEER